MKKYVALLLAVVMVFAMTACDNHDEPDVSGQPPADQTELPTQTPPAVGGETPEEAQERIYQEGLEWLQTEAKLDFDNVTAFDFKRLADIYNAAAKYWTTQDEYARENFQAVREMLSLSGEGDDPNRFLGQNIGILQMEPGTDNLSCMSRGYSFHIGHTNGQAYYIDALDDGYNYSFMDSELCQRTKAVTEAVWGLIADKAFLDEAKAAQAEREFSTVINGVDWTVHVKANTSGVYGVWAMRNDQDDRWNVPELVSQWNSLRNDALAQFDAALYGEVAEKYHLLLTEEDMTKLLTNYGYGNVKMSMTERVVRKTYCGDSVNYSIEANGSAYAGDVGNNLQLGCSAEGAPANIIKGSKVKPDIAAAFSFTVMPDGSYADVRLNQKVLQNSELKGNFSDSNLKGGFAEANRLAHKLLNTLGVTLTDQGLDTPVIETNDWGGSECKGVSTKAMDISGFMKNSDTIAFGMEGDYPEDIYTNRVTASALKSGSRDYGSMSVEWEMNVYSTDVTPDGHAVEFYLAQ